MIWRTKQSKTKGLFSPFFPDKQHILASGRFVSWPELKVGHHPRLERWQPHHQDALTERLERWSRSLARTTWHLACPAGRRTLRYQSGLFSSCTRLLFRSEEKSQNKVRIVSLPAAWLYYTVYSSHFSEEGWDGQDSVVEWLAAGFHCFRGAAPPC